MDEMEQKLGAILGNPDMMQQIMSMAQSLSHGQIQGEQPDPSQPPPQQEAPDLGGIDLGTIQKIAGFAKQSNIDNDQRNLLKALAPYLSRGRIHKLEKAMRAVKLARLASSALGQLNLTGR